MLLGEFSIESIRRTVGEYGSDWAFIMQTENWFAMSYFLGMTFFTQITILNMLIAIMSSTFDR